MKPTREMQRIERKISRMVRRHPLLRSGIPDRDLARIMMRDFKTAYPDAAERHGRGLMVEFLTKLIECIQRGDAERVLEILSPFPEPMALKLIEAINRAIEKGSAGEAG